MRSLHCSARGLALALTLLAVGCSKAVPEASTQALLAPGRLPGPGPTLRPSPLPVTPAPPGSYYSGPAELEKYVVKFVDDAKRQGVDVTPYLSNPPLKISIGNLDSYSSSTIGVCVSSNSKRNVTIDPGFWNSASEARRELLMHHELGHCVLDRRHLSAKLPNGNFVSLMYPKIMPSSTYLTNYEYYQGEFYSAEARGWSTDADLESVDVCDVSEVI